MSCTTSNPVSRGRSGQNLQIEPHTAERSGFPADIDVARIVFPEVAIADDGHLVAKVPQSAGKCGVDVAVLT